MPGIIRLGDNTTGGGKVVSCRFAPFYTDSGVPCAVLGDKATCPKHNGVFAFVECESSTTYNGRGVVLEGHKLACGCTAISSASAWHIVQPSSPAFAPEPAPAPTTSTTQALDPAPATATAPNPVAILDDEPAVADDTPANVLVTLRIGVFFDGTGNNTNNVRIGAQCRAEAKTEHEKAVLLAGCEHVDDISYGNSDTNVRKLFLLYPDSQPNNQPITSGSDYFIKLYIEGDGTFSGEGDSTYGLAVGGGASGMPHRVVEAFHDNLLTALKRFADAHSNAYAQAIELDIFGFSRGAAEARHFLYKLNLKGQGPLGEVIPESALNLKPGFDWATDLRAGFVGLFDTVTHLGIPANTSVADLATGGFDQQVHPHDATRGIMQLSARDEKRANFPLTSIAPPFHDISLPGVHSDIGGGYLDNAVESVWLIRPVISYERVGRPLQRSRAYREAARQLERLQAKNPANAASMRVHCWSEEALDQEQRDTRWGRSPTQPVAATVLMTRTLSNGYAGIALRIMYALAAKVGVQWKQSPDDVPSMRLPDDLHLILAQLLSYAQTGNFHLNPDDERMLRKRYIHQSANWTVSDDSVYPLSIFYVNRPTENDKRVVIPNEETT